MAATRMTSRRWAAWPITVLMTLAASAGAVATPAGVMQSATTNERNVDDRADADDPTPALAGALAENAALRVIVMGVEGTAQALVRVDPDAAARRLVHSVVATSTGEVEIDVIGDAEPSRRESRWVDVEAGMSLPAGAAVRTGVRSNVVLRLGLNATVRVNALSRVSIDALARDVAASNGDETTDESTEGVLRTRLTLDTGDLDVRVDHVGDFANDFSVRTPEATLAVRGTNFSVGVDALSGLRVQGAETNSLRAIELDYVNDELDVALSSGRIDGLLRDPALLALAATVARPNEGVRVRSFRDRIGRRVIAAVTSGGVARREPVTIRSGEIITANAAQLRDRIDGERERPDKE
jgi:hypothetical protein